VKVEKLAKNGQMVQNSQPLSPHRPLSREGASFYPHTRATFDLNGNVFWVLAENDFHGRMCLKAFRHKSRGFAIMLTRICKPVGFRKVLQFKYWMLLSNMFRMMGTETTPLNTTLNPNSSLNRVLVVVGG